MYTLLLLDLSDSIRRSGALEPLLDAAETLVRRIFETNDGNVHRMTVYWFDGSASIHPALEDGMFSSDQSEIISTIRSLPASNDRSTNLFGAVVESLSVLRKTLDGTDDGIIRRGNFVLFTDGSDNAGRVSRQIAVQRINQEVGDGKQLDKDIRAFTIGLGGEIDIPVLQEIGRTQNVFPQNVSELFPAFDAIASRIQDLAASFYLLEYCSPKRAGQHDLKVEVALGDEVGFLTTRFDARGFTAECAIDFIDSEVDGFSGSGNSRGLEVRLGSDGERYVVGDFDGSFAVGGIEMSSRRRSGFVARVGPDENGSPVRAAWSFGGGDASVEPESLAVLPGEAGEQSVVVAGHFSGRLEIDGVAYDPQGKRHGFLARFDPAGELVWFRHFGGESTQLREVEFSRFQAVDEEGVPIGPTERSVVVVGEYEKLIDIDGTPAFETNGDRDAFVAKFDLDGNLLWRTRVSSGGDDVANTVEVSPSGAVYVAGFIGAPVGDLEDPTVDSDTFPSAFVTRLRADDGRRRWIVGFGSPEDPIVQGRSQAEDLAIGPFGSVIVAARYIGTALCGDESVTLDDESMNALLVKLTDRGRLEWCRAVGGPGDDRLQAVAIDSNGDVSALGTFTRTINLQGPRFTAQGESEDIFLLRVTGTDGRNLASYTFGGPAQDRAMSIAISDDDDAQVTGWFTESASFFDSTVMGEGRNAFLFRIR